MRLNPIILTAVIILGIIVGLSSNKSMSTSTLNKSNNNEQPDSAIEKVTNPDKEVPPNGLTIKYFKQYFEGNDYLFIGPSENKSTYVYRTEKVIPETGLVIGIDIYQEKSSEVICLFEVQVDGINLLNQGYKIEDIQKYVTQSAKSILPIFAQIPYKTADPELAKQWVMENVEKAYSENGESIDGENYFENVIGYARFKMYGSPELRFLDINLGFTNEWVEKD
jgi:ABC-type antimicrobial peptide transport system permease subunit